ncbi:MAG: hypothetical protein GTO45_17535 [Candidatus Aminicenantes bacterium]|nr:hypothetical protein [Candidatus Aminicenantes bacterium]NIM80552.1 hypothetical protein [Candidatus Aminicenantes bacterium]NIN19933.1 hypothetical protein [Candidatus Aminicenantes bacterium]NIN43781.1 hypothetical protein [Candidatus Aminicenantes bacterium]NIN86559.1 hypothetical protein [Candidatus Aminicenantes bacterium]
MKNKMICPYCLEQKTIAVRKDKNKKSYYSCSACNSIIPREYAENTAIPREVVSAVGFRGHGKTINFSSLFYSVDELASIWPGFYSFAIDEKSLETLRNNINKLKKGELPPPSPTSFPTPTIVRFSNIPGLGDRFFLFYDTSGEAYTNASRLITNARFVKRSQVVIFLISLKDLDYDGSKMHDLLSVYIQGLTELEGNPKDQHLLVVFSKGDVLNPIMDENSRWKEIWQYLTNGGLKSLENIKIKKYIAGMKKASNILRDFTRIDLKATQFLNFAKNRFKTVEFSIISSLGANPVESRLQVEITPKRIFDPLLWVTYQSLSWFKKLISI